MPRKEMTEQEKNPENFFPAPEGVHPVDRIKLHESPDIPKEGRYVALNGANYLIPPEVEVDVPRPVRLMLDTRIATLSEMNYDAEGKPVHTSRNIRRVPYTLIKEDVRNTVPLAPVNDEQREAS